MDVVSSFVMLSGPLLRIAALVLLFPMLRYVSFFIGQAVSVRLSRHSGSLISLFIFYGGCAFIAINILHECGFNVTALLGAAGIVGVALGFASQTSIANIISGFFLLLEGPFSIGDTIKSGETYGVVEAIDLLATRVKTNDNKLIRIPNEMMLKQPLINLTHHKERRIDLLVSIPYTVAHEKIAERFKNAVIAVPFCLSEKQVSIEIAKIAPLDLTPEIRLFFSLKIGVLTKDFSQAPSAFMAALQQSCENDGLKITVTQQNER